ncbi:MAG: tetratricopeptide repeat protein [Saprospiraceae bacterium]
MKILEKYYCLPKKWQFFTTSIFFSTSVFSTFSLFIICFFSINQQGFAQNYNGQQFVKQGLPTMKAYEKAGAKAFERENYAAAMEHYQNALKIDSTKIENYYKLGLAARAFDANLEAKEAFAKVKLLNDSLNPFPNYKEAIFLYSIIEKEQGNEDNAIILKEELGANYAVPQFKFTKINNMEEWNQIENICYDELTDASAQITVTQLDSTVNTIYSEVNPFLLNGKFHYASLRFPKEEDEHSPARLYAKTLHGELGEECDAWEMNIPNKTTAHFTFDFSDDSSDSLMYFSICDYPKGKESTLQCELYYREKIKGVWGMPNKLAKKINQVGYTTTHPAIGLNEANEKVLFYVSDRLGGKGGLDIWSVPILAPNSFGEPKPLAINTNQNDITPFYHQETSTLYFSSQGNKKVRHYDVYKMISNTTGSIEPLPYPINSEADDFGYFLAPNEEIGFLASSRANCNELESGEWACHDIFQIDVKKQAPVLQVQLFDGETKTALDRGIITLVGGEKNKRQENIYGHNFYFSEVSPELTYSLMADRKGYYSQRIDCPIIPPSDTLVVPIYLEPYCGDAITTIELFDADKKLPLNTGFVTIRTAEMQSPQFGNQNGSEFIFDNIQRQSIYQIEVRARGFHDQKITQVLNRCDTLRIDLIPQPFDNPKFDTIACYFDHDRPKKAGDKPYSDLYTEYLTRYGKYQNRFARVGGKGVFDPTFCGQLGNNILEDSVTTFFCNKVDYSFKLLTSFKDALLEELETLDKNGDPYIINIKGYTSPIGDSPYNLALAGRRIESIKQYFLSIPELNKYFFNENDKGDTNPLLIFEELPFGEDGTPPVFKRENDYRNTIYNPHSAVKRRVEIIRRPPEITNSQSFSEE